MRGLNGGAQDPRADGQKEGGGEIGRGLDGKPADTGEQHAAHDLVPAPCPGDVPVRRRQLAQLGS
jgi:hypothetical protein